MNTTENNKKIAEFLGIEAFKDLLASLNNGNININIDIYEQAKFHSDWNWLMKVVIECFNRSEDMLDDINFKLNDALLETNIESLYKAVITFIDWYNENGAKEN